MSRGGREPVAVTLTLAEAKALKDATGFGGGEPTTPKEMAALDRALRKIERAQERFIRGKKQRSGNA